MLECIKAYLRVLKSDGFVVSNFFSEDETQYRQTYARALFKHIYRDITKDNYIAIGLNQQAPALNRNELQFRFRALQQNKLLADMNWIQKVKHIHNTNDDK
ncbi:unnamed protein product [Rotaria socialis]|uniref:Uncharacterized protein n=1 Tax=Rotaria socialis TaxID=392032 RepID=A0A820SUX8_9BILA|nr:unnamed protein product [Rotaria socialis]CAF3311929.1 unnamed protein product [Rotaria socialis]CAF3325414.1 unnamed protein product [Rotaria socialis]CAF3347726.1 unnamed protein product [Rotaria socialis]CAF4381693.1 unnamed protein product [Rotaria socialis]